MTSPGEDSRPMNLWKRIEIALAAAAALTGMGMALDLSIRSYKTEDVSFRILVLLSSLPSVVFGVASYFHAVKSKKWAMVLMFVAGSINNALILSSAVVIVYVLAVFQDAWGLIALIANFLLVIITLAVVFVGWDPFRDDSQPNELK